MKLRLRNYESKETQRIQLPSPCSFLQLQETLFASLLSPPPHLSPSSFCFSLNAKDRLLAPSPQTSLQSIGVASGDLIFFSFNPNAFSAVPSTQDPQSVTLAQDPNQMSEFSNNQETPVQELIQFLDPISTEPEISQETQGTEFMDIDDFALGAKSSEPYFLRKVMSEELGDNGSIHKLFAIAVHAVLLESGFVGIDPVSGMQNDRFHLPDEFASPFSLCYSLPELLRADYNSSSGSNLTDYVVLKFLTLGQFIQVYGSLVKGSMLHKLSLDEHRFAPTLNLVWVNCGKNDKKDGSINSYPENEVFEFWRIVKDGLALPLLIDLCSETGLALPACLIRLPTELKLKILESLPGADIARMECVCSEMRYLASNNDLWKQKFAEEFGDLSGAAGMGNWKKMFHSCWEKGKKQSWAITRWQGYPRVDRPFYIPTWRDLNPMFAPPGVPGVVGGDYDLMPGLIMPHPLPLRFRGRRNAGFHCNLGGQNDA
ncbi:pentatricopeptide repeat-containing family protein [Hibiscus syriacus]|uniref:Pentatricopeptide repeat-containing family protein n=1 Tax=Hibiscus syriacus TaxID=106335 RepID=A0A6A3AUR4_HIBSY|nr:F-box protein SKIP22-like [Hibiscus syriacus]KAE8708411.1 pentatricopeptide repeat-containing family protein [Hibiscus syriacus]